MSKVWMITGCSSGLGKSIAQAVLTQGDTAIITARHTDSLQELVQSYPHQVFPISLDLTDPQSIQEAASLVLERFRSIDVLVNNAGHGYRATIEESESDAIQELFLTNFFGPMELIRALLPSMRANHKGQIINISSIGAIRGALGNGYYSAAKGALELASEALEKEISHLHLHVMLVEPGGFRTGFYGHRLQETRQSISDYDCLASQYRKENTTHSPAPGDPVKAGQWIVQVARSEHRPFHLLLGKDAYTQAKSTFEKRLQEIEDWKHISLQSDFEEKKGTCL